MYVPAVPAGAIRRVTITSLLKDQAKHREEPKAPGHRYSPFVADKRKEG